jgi:hypothetical protein
MTCYLFSSAGCRVTTWLVATLRTGLAASAVGGSLRSASAARYNLARICHGAVQGLRGHGMQPQQFLL